MPQTPTKYVRRSERLPIVYAAALPPTLKLVVLILDDFTGSNDECWPSLTTIASAARVSRGHLIRLLKDLAERGLIAWEKRDAPAGGPATNRYRIDYERLAALGPDTDNPEPPDPSDDLGDLGAPALLPSRAGATTPRRAGATGVGAPALPPPRSLRNEPSVEPPVRTSPPYPPRGATRDEGSNTRHPAYTSIEPTPAGCRSISDGVAEFRSGSAPHASRGDTARNGSSEAVDAPAKTKRPTVDRGCAQRIVASSTNVQNEPLDVSEVTESDRAALCAAAPWRYKAGAHDLRYLNDAMRAVATAAENGDIVLLPGERHVEFLIRRAKVYGASEQARGEPRYRLSLGSFLNVREKRWLLPDEAWARPAEAETNGHVMPSSEAILAAADRVDEIRRLAKVRR